MPAGQGFMRYVRKAFLVHWNLLAVGAGALFGIISGRPDVFLPIFAAGEIAYLAVLSTNARFQKVVDAEEFQRKQQSVGQDISQQARQILLSLKIEDRRQFENLKALCLELRRISRGVKVGEDVESAPVDDMQSNAINKLLWIYLKLLYSKTALERFFSTIDEKEIQDDIARTKKRLEEMPTEEQDTPTDAKRRASLKDTLTTGEQRIENYKRASDNYDLIKLELDRLYSKISGLGEMSINRQDPNFITVEVDSVTASVQQTEKAMGELQFITGLTTQSDSTPPLLEGEQIIPTVKNS